MSDGFSASGVYISMSLVSASFAAASVSSACVARFSWIVRPGFSRITSTASRTVAAIRLARSRFAPSQSS